MIADVRPMYISIYSACIPASNQLGASKNHWPSTVKCLRCKTKALENGRKTFHQNLSQTASMQN